MDRSWGLSVFKYWPEGQVANGVRSAKLRAPGTWKFGDAIAQRFRCLARGFSFSGAGCCCVGQGFWRFGWGFIAVLFCTVRGGREA
jgi:hypothetical protein